MSDINLLLLHTVLGMTLMQILFTIILWPNTLLVLVPLLIRWDFYTLSLFLWLKLRLPLHYWLDPAPHCLPQLHYVIHVLVFIFELSHHAIIIAVWAVSRIPSLIQLQRFTCLAFLQRGTALVHFNWFLLTLDHLWGLLDCFLVRVLQITQRVYKVFDLALLYNSVLVLVEALKNLIILLILHAITPQAQIREHLLDELFRFIFV